MGYRIAKGVSERCIARLLLTSPGWIEQKILLLEHVNSFAISRFSPSMTGICIMVSISDKSSDHFTYEQ